MFSRRQKAVVALIVSSFQLVVIWVARRYATAVNEGRAPSADELEAAYETSGETRADKSEQSEDGTAANVQTTADSDDTPSIKTMMIAGWADRYGDRQIKLRWVGVGAIKGILYGVAYDYDIFSLRSNVFRELFRRWIMLSVNEHLLDDDATFSTTVGTALGTVCYRTVYGLLRDPPGSDT